MENVILSKTIEFSLQIIKYVELLEEKRKFVIANQLLKCGTSIGANVHEAQNAESKADFIHKFKIAAKEIEETKYWLVLCKNSIGYPDCIYLEPLLHEIEKIVTKIIATSRYWLIIKLSNCQIVKLSNYQINYYATLHNEPHP
jgi:four helix bundle protein